MALRAWCRNLVWWDRLIIPLRLLRLLEHLWCQQLIIFAPREQLANSLQKIVCGRKTYFCKKVSDIFSNRNWLIFFGKIWKISKCLPQIKHSFHFAPVCVCSALDKVIGTLSIVCNLQMTKHVSKCLLPWNIAIFLRNVEK